MRILIIANEVWNDRVHGNNVLTNWFSGFDAEFAEIYCSPGSPLNACCERYFQVTDAMMARSFVGKRAGHTFSLTKEHMQEEKPSPAQQPSAGFYRFMKSIASTPVLAMRDLIWLYGRYDLAAMRRFVESFDPDIVFCPRLLSPKLLRLERMISTMTSAPIVAFTGDDEASLQQVSYSPIYWLRRYLFHRAFGRNMKIYSHYFMHSSQQAQEYTTQYGVSTERLFKCGNFTGTPLGKNVNSPIKLVYAGRLYCNRWKTLAEIGKALHKINADAGREKIILEIYTKDKLSREQSKALSIDNHIYLKGGVPANELAGIYRGADIALHVESFDRRNKYVTRVSFSTKIIDCMASSCAVMAICWDQQTGFKYLQDNDAAFCISSYDQILPTLSRICDHPELIPEYAGKAWLCGQEHHSKEHIQKQLQTAFNRLIKSAHESSNC